jgi:hypothetical protein
VGRLSRLLRRHERDLVCDRCGAVVARARVGPVALIEVRDAAGVAVAPLSGAVAAGVARVRLSAAEAAADRVGRYPGEDLEVLAARRAVEYLREQLGELAFDLACPSCEGRWWRSLPELAAAVRAGGTDGVRLERA